jgi:hypothetical protein
VRAHVEISKFTSIHQFSEHMIKQAKFLFFLDEERRQNEQMLDRMVKEVDRIKTAERHRREMEERLLQCMADAERQLQKVKSVEVRMLDCTSIL